MLLSASKKVCAKDIGSRASMVPQNYQLIEITSNMIYIVALGVSLKYPPKIHLNTQYGGGLDGQKHFRRVCKQLNIKSGNCVLE